MRNRARYLLSFVVLLVCSSFISLAYSQAEVTPRSFATVSPDEGSFFLHDTFKITGIAPWDLGQAEIIDPDSNTTYAPLFWLTSHSITDGMSYGPLLDDRRGSYSSYNYPIPDGTYTYSFSDQSGAVLAGSPIAFDYTYDGSVPTVEILTLPAHQSYTGTTTPTFEWEAPGGDYYYQVIIRDYWERDLFLWFSPLQGPGAGTRTLPMDPGILEEEREYVWAVVAYDTNDEFTSRNQTISEDNSFYTGTHTGSLPASLDKYLESFSRIRTTRDESFIRVLNEANDASGALGLAEWDASMTIIGPDGFNETVDSTKSYKEISQIADGTYTVVLTDMNPAGTGQVSSGQTVFAGNWDLPLLDRDQIYQIEPYSYIYTTQPTFEWQSLDSAVVTGYRAQVFSYSDLSNGRFSFHHIWTSDTTSETSVQVPDGLLQTDNAYLLRMETRGVNSNNARGNTPEDFIPFFVAGDDAPLSISGQITTSPSPTLTGQVAWVAATDSPENPVGDDTNIYAFTLIEPDSFSTGVPYTLHNIPRNTNVYVHALFDTDDSFSSSVGDLIGSYTTETDPEFINIDDDRAQQTGIDVDLNDEIAAASSLNGSVTCDNCTVSTANPIMVEVLNDDDEVLAGPFLTTTGDYSFGPGDNIPVGVEVWIRAFWDSDGSGGFTDSDQVAWSEAVVVDTTNNVDPIAIEMQGFICGTVIDDQNDPIENQPVDIWGMGGNQNWYQAYTDANGDYCISVPDGDYGVSLGDDPENQYVMMIYDDLVYQDESATTTVTVDSQNSGLPNLGVIPFGSDGIDFKREKGRFISGTVTGASGGGPLEGVEVAAFYEVNNNGFRVISKRTDASGYYELLVPDNAGYYVHADARYAGLNYFEGFYQGISPWDDVAAPLLVTGADVAGIDIVLDPAVYISGVVTDSETTDPVSGLSLGAFDDQNNWVNSADTETDGSYAILVPANSSYYVQTCAQCNGHEYLDQYWGGVNPWDDGSTPNVDVTDEDRTGINFVIEQGVWLAGTVYNSEGTKISGLQIIVRDENVIDVGWGETNVDGIYNILVAENQDYYVMACPGCWTESHPDGLPYLETYHDDINPWDEGSSPNVLVLESNVGSIDIYLKNGYNITGIVKDTDENPLSGITIIAQDGNVWDIAYTETGADGSYSLLVEDLQSYYVLVCAECWNDTYPDGAAYVSQYYGDVNPWDGVSSPNVPVNGADVPGIDFDLTPGIRIKGTVYEAGSTPVPITGLNWDQMWIEIFDGMDACSGNWVNNISVNEDGTYTTPALPSGTYFIQATPVCIGYIATDCNDAVTVEIQGSGPGDHPDPVDLILDPGSIIKGHVSDSGGTPVNWIPVDAFDTTTDDGYWGQTRDWSDSYDSGDYCISVPTGGEYYVEIGCTVDCGYNYVPERYDNKFNNEFTPVAVTGATFDDVNFVLSEIVQGDLNADEAVELDDAIISLKAITDNLNGETILKTGDVDYNNQIGLPETIYILKDVAQ